MRNSIEIYPSRSFIPDQTVPQPRRERISETRVDLQFTDNDMDPFWGGGGGGRGGAYLARCRGVSLAVTETTGPLLVEQQTVAQLHTGLALEALRVACIERVHCANATRTSNNNSSVSKKSCASLSVAFLAVIISSPMDSVRSRY